MLRDVVVCDLHRQGDMLGAIRAAGTDLCCEAFDLARRGEAPLQYGLLEDMGGWVSWTCLMLLN